MDIKDIKIKIGILSEKRKLIFEKLKKIYLSIIKKIEKALQKYIIMRNHIDTCTTENCKYCNTFKNEIKKALIEIDNLPKMHFEYKFLWTDNRKLFYTIYMIGIIDYDGNRYGITIDEMENGETLLISDDCKYLLVASKLPGNPYKIYEIFKIYVY